MKVHLLYKLAFINNFLTLLHNQENDLFIKLIMH